MNARLPTVEELTAMILEARREPGIWRVDTQAKWLAKRIARFMEQEGHASVSPAEGRTSILSEEGV